MTSYGESGLECTKCDITDRRDVSATVRGADVVLHLAAEARPRLWKDPEDYRRGFETNVRGLYNVIEACVSHGARLVFPSTREVYRQPASNPIPEDHPVAPGTLYVTSKLVGELHCQSFAENLGLEFVTLRLTNVFGPGDKNRLIPVLLERASRNKPLEIFENQVIDFVYVGDVAEALLLAATGDGLSGQAFNVGTGVGHPLTKVAELVKRLLSSSSPIRVMNPSSMKAIHILDTEKAKQNLRFEAKYDLQHGLEETIEADGQYPIHSVALR